MATYRGVLITGKTDAEVAQQMKNVELYGSINAPASPPAPTPTTPTPSTPATPATPATPTTPTSSIAGYYHSKPIYSGTDAYISQQMAAIDKELATPTKPVSNLKQTDPGQYYQQVLNSATATPAEKAEAQRYLQATESGQYESPNQPTLPTPPAKTVNPPAYSVSYQDYIVKSEDTLSAIAAKYGVDMGQISGYRSGNPNLIYPGEKLSIGVKAATAGATPTTTGETGTGLPPNATATDIQKKIAELQQKIATTTDQMQKEKYVQEMVQMAASLGLAYPTEAIKGLTPQTGLTKQQILDEANSKYGITGLEEAMKSRPTQTFEQIYQTIYTQLGLTDVKDKIAQTLTEINKADDDFATATGNINENPWISESGRVGKIRKVTEQYNLTRQRLDNQRTLLENLMTRGQQEAKDVSTRTLNEFAQERKYDIEELDYYIKRAEAEADAQWTTQQEQQASEVYRYYPEYMQSYKPKTTATKTEKVVEIKSYLTPTDYKNLSAKGIDKSTADAISIALQEGRTLEEIRLGLANIYGKDQGYQYLDIFMEYIQK
jgi:LysM repeat protein